MRYILWQIKIVCPIVTEVAKKKKKKKKVSLYQERIDDLLWWIYSRKLLRIPNFPSSVYVVIEIRLERDGTLTCRSSSLKELKANQVHIPTFYPDLMSPKLIIDVSGLE